MKAILTSSIILLAETTDPHRYVFGAYDNQGKATGFVKLPEDHKMFIDTLVGEQTVMGAKTLDATPETFPDAGRICITHHPEKIRKKGIPAQSIEEGIQIAKQRAKEKNKNKIYVIGGAHIIAQCLEKNILDEIILTIVSDYYEEADRLVYLDFDIEKWDIIQDSGELISSESKPEKLKYRFYTLRKKQ